MLPRNKSPLEQLQDEARAEALKALGEFLETNFGQDDLLLIAQGAAMEHIEKATGTSAAVDASLLNLADVVGREALSSFLASQLRKIPSKNRSNQSRVNGKKGGRKPGSKNKPKGKDAG